ncbi:puratrophin-1 [Pelodytes ibericus]
MECGTFVSVRVGECGTCVRVGECGTCVRVGECGTCVGECGTCVGVGECGTCVGVGECGTCVGVGECGTCVGVGECGTCVGVRVGECGTCVGECGTCVGECGTCVGECGTCVGECGTCVGECGTCVRECGTCVSVGECGTCVSVGECGTCVGECGTCVGECGTCVGECGTCVGECGTCVGECGTCVGECGTCVGECGTCVRECGTCVSVGECGTCVSVGECGTCVGECGTCVGECGTCVSVGHVSVSGSDSQSLDGCIQKTLSSLYPPFEITAATVLCQVLDVVDKTYRGDGLSYLIDFLIPAKRVLQGLQQEACLQYCGLLFRHSGWPLCIQEKIVLQLASIDWRLLQPGDFYLQVVPHLRKTPRVILKCLADDQHSVEELVLPEVSFSSIFTLEWLEYINSGRMGSSLENFLLTADNQLLRVPWEMVVHPEFVEKTEATEMCATPAAKEEPSTRDSRLRDEESGVTTPDTKPESEQEGEYVELADISVPRFGPQLGSLTQSIALNFRSQQKFLNQRPQNKPSALGITDDRTCNESLVSSTLVPTCLQLDKSASRTHQTVEISRGVVECNLAGDVGCTGREEPENVEPALAKHSQQEALVCVDGTAKRVCHAAVQNQTEGPACEGSGHTKMQDREGWEQRCPGPDHFSKSLSQFTHCTEDPTSMAEVPQEPATEHSRTRVESPTHCTHQINCDQTVPCLGPSMDSKARHTESGKEGVSDGNGYTDHIQAEQLYPPDHVLEESAVVESGHDLPAVTPHSVCLEQGEGLDASLVNGVSEGKTMAQSYDSIYLGMKAEQDPCMSSGGEVCLYYPGTESDKAPLPLETLHEMIEDEQGACDASDPPSARDGQTAQDNPLTEQAGEESTQSVDRISRATPVDPVSSPGINRSYRCEAPLTLVKDVNMEILRSGLVYLPGTRDRSGRAVLVINTRNTAWLNPHCNASELSRLFHYFYRIPRRDCQALGLTLVVDARRCSPVPALFKAFHLLQATVPGCIHGILLLAEKDLTAEKPQGVLFDLLTSTKSLHKHMEASQLPLEFDGSFTYCHRDWLAFRMKFEHLQEGCLCACSFLQNAIRSMHTGTMPGTAEEASQLLKRFGQLMKAVLEDTRLVQLQTEGGAMLARLRKEESCVALTVDYREAVKAASDLYNRVDEGVHSLVKISNKRIQDVEMVVEFHHFKERFQEVRGWMDSVGEHLLAQCGVLEDSLEVILQAQRHFKEFEGLAAEYCRRGREMLQSMERWESLLSPELQTYGRKLQECKEKVEGFAARLEECSARLEKTVRLYQFFDKAYEWALEGMRHLASISLDDCNSSELCGTALEGLERYRVQHPEIGEKKFEEMRELACELKSERGAKQWKFAWSKCQEARHVWEKKLEAARRAKKLSSGEQSSPGSASYRRHSDGKDDRDNMPHYQNKPLGSPLCSRERRLSRMLGNITDQTPYKSSPLSSVFRMRKMSLQSIPGEEPCFDFLHQEPPGSSTPTVPSRPITRRLLRKAQSFDLPGSEGAIYGCQRRLSEPARRGNTGVFIKGLEVSSTELADRPCSPRQPPPLDWSADRLLGDRRSSVSSADGRSRSSKLRHIIDEMVTTEREYVRSLWYISENYFPEMERLDLPQDLRGKRGIIFGNLEKLRDFHSQYFLKELESCCNHPLRVSHCFLRHKDQFGMYALYSKNKPRSDLLLASHGNIFFKNKQRQLGDKMDLASYLLKPIQRMSKYALLLKDLIKECGEAQDQELVYLRAAEEMVKFQLRHGNDLLAMDAIRDCDVNLKEQGQLVRQDEFTVWLGRKKCQRHVFLFEDLILFSKPKRMEGGLDVYIYKRSFKTADIGLTENSGDSGLRFEIWFRRRKSNDTHILQSSSPEIKHSWTCDIAKILWQQATRNKEVRMQEMVSMGVGNKPFLDIKPSDAAINNRAIDYIMKGRGARTRASIAVSLFDHSDPYKRTPAPITCSSTPSACGPSSTSLLGPLNLHMYVNQSLLPGVLSSNRPFEARSCLEEDELEHETSSSQPSMTTESSGSSQCMSGAGSSGSDSGCVSGIPQDNLSEDAASPCDAAIAHYSAQEARHQSGLVSPSMNKSRFINRQYISANTSHISLSPSTIV